MRDTDLDFLTCREVVAFIPTDRHEMIRFRLQKYVNPMVLAKIDVTNLSLLSHHLSPSMVKEIMDEARKHPEFIDWLVAEDEAVLMLQKARKSAAAALLDAVEMDVSEDPKLRAIQIKAAEAILKMKPDAQQQKVSQTLKVSALPSNLRTLAGKSVDELNEELRQLKESN